MSIDNLVQYGIQSASFVSRDLAVQKTSIIKDVSAFDFSGLTPAIVTQVSGASPLPVSSALGDASGDISMTLEQPNKELYEIVGRKNAIITSISSEIPSIEYAKNLNGSTILNAVTGLIVGIKAGNEDNLKAGRYIITAISSTSVNVVYLGSDFIKKDNEGTINLLPLTVVVATAVDINNDIDTSNVVNTGLEITGGSGAIALNIGDSAMFTVSLGRETSRYEINPNEAICPRSFSLLVSTRPVPEAGKCKFTSIYIPLVTGLFDRTFPVSREYSSIELAMKAISTQESVVITDHYLK
jgi:hypothetical protein